MPTALWKDPAPQIPVDEFEQDATVDDVIVGAGFTGLITALMLARLGRRVLVLEARTVGANASGNTTAKLSVLQGTHLQKVRANSFASTTQAYADGQVAAFDWMTDYLDATGTPFERRDAITYAGTSAGRDAVRREFDVARSVGLDVELVTQVDLPFPTFGGVALRDQAQFDPMLVLQSLAKELRELGGRICDGVRVTGVRASLPARVRTTAGTVWADRVVLATGTPMLDRGLYFAKLAAQRSYAISYDVADGDVGAGMFLNAETPTRSIRWAGNRLLVGGNGHGVGRRDSPAEAVRELDDWAMQRWPSAVRTHDWAAQDYRAPSHIPFVGPLPRGRGRILLATGYDKWGMTNSVAAAQTLVADITGAQKTPWQRALRHRVTVPRSVATGIGENAAVGWWYAKGYGRALSHRLPDSTPAEGTAVIGRARLLPTGKSTVGGVTCSVALTCPHLGAALGWNDSELSWDCPAHGSRFAADGTLLEGPAKRDLRRR